VSYVNPLQGVLHQQHSKRRRRHRRERTNIKRQINAAVYSGHSDIWRDLYRTLRCTIGIF